MANKKNQHLVPACYLKSFISDVPKSEANNPRFQTGVYVNSKFLDGKWKLKGINNGVFTESYYYTLPEEDPDHPAIENFLSVIESSFRKNLKKLENREITNEVLSYLSYFTTLQYLRVKKHINSFQDTYDKIGENLYHFTGDNQYQKQVEDLAKKLIPFSDLGGIPHPYASIIYNNTSFPFLTSDNPVTIKRVNKRDLELVMPQHLIDRTIPESKEYTLFLFPLTPKIAYISCELIQDYLIIDFDEEQLSEIFYINYWCIRNAYAQVYSSVREPFKGEKQISDYIKSSRNYTYIKIYTEDHRIKAEGSVLDSNLNTISFIFRDRDKLKNLNQGMPISLCEVIDNGISIIGLRNCTIKNLNIDTGLVIIESNFELQFK